MLAALGICGLAFAAAAGAQTTTSSTKVVSFEVVSVDGNKVVAKTAAGAKEYTVTDDFRFTVDGKPIGVHELHPGMKGTAQVTTTTTVTPVHITEVKNGEVMQASGNSVIVRTDNGIKMFSEGDMAKRNISIIKDGQPVALADLHTGDRLSATIVTQGTPKVMTESQVHAAMTRPARASNTAASSASAAPAAAPAATSGSGAAPAKHLPKTASQRPLVGLLGGLALATALALTAIRRRRGAI